MIKVMRDKVSGGDDRDTERKSRQSGGVTPGFINGKVLSQKKTTRLLTTLPNQ